MNVNDIAFVLFIVAVIAAVLGGFGIAGLGKDSRGLDTRSQPGDRSTGSLQS